MKAWPVLLLLVPALAGCSDPAEAAEEEAPGPAAMPSPSGPAVLPPPPAPPAPVPFSWSGHTKEGAWVCMEQDGAGQCPAGQQVAPDGQHVTAVPYAGNLTAIELAMTWQPDPTQTGLVLAVYGNTTGGRRPIALAQGDPPLELRIDAPGLVPDNALVLMAWPEGKTPTSPSVFVDATQQAFTVEGTLWLAAG